jgi:RNA chaperone Hfq
VQKELDFKTFFSKVMTSSNNNVAIYLVNGIRLKGPIVGIDAERACLFIENNNGGNEQLVFFHAISTIGTSTTE